MKLKITFGTMGLFFCMTVSALAGEGTIDSGDTAWLIVSTALVMMIRWMHLVSMVFVVSGVRWPLVYSLILLLRKGPKAFYMGIRNSSGFS